LVPGDELRLRYPGDSQHAPWQCVGHVTKLASKEKLVLYYLFILIFILTLCYLFIYLFIIFIILFSLFYFILFSLFYFIFYFIFYCVEKKKYLYIDEEVSLELRSNANVPIAVTRGFTVDFVWKATSFERLKKKMRNNKIMMRNDIIIK